MDDATDATAPQAKPSQALPCRLKAIHDYIAAAARGSALGPPPPADGIYGRLEFVACADGILPHKEDLRRHANPAPGIARADAGFVFGPETLAKLLPCLPVAKSLLVRAIGLRQESVDKHFTEIAAGREVRGGEAQAGGPMG